jgi:S1-C subfamily serine protease
MGDGVFVTAAHVVSGGGRIVLNSDLIQVEASITLIDERADIAELRAPSAAVLPSLGWSPRETITPGLTVATVGYPIGVVGRGSLSRGVVSRLFTESGLHQIQTDVPVNPGNSGGALVDECGDVLGVVVSKVSGVVIEGIAYAIEERSVRDALSQTVTSTRLEAAQALHSRGGTNFEQGDYAAAIADYTLIVKRYSNDIDPAMREQVAESLVNRGISHYAQGDLAAEIADYTLVVNSYSTDAGPAIRKQVAKALYYRGLTHHEKGDFTAAIADYTSVVESYSADADPAIRAWVAEALAQLAKLAD